MSLVVPIEEIFGKATGLLASHASWARVILGDVCCILNGYPFKSKSFNTSEGFPIVRIRDLARGSTATFYKGSCPSEYIVRNGDLLIGMDGNFGCYEWLGGEAGLNQRVCKITPDDRILLPKFLLFGINAYLKAIQDATSSVTVGHLSSRDIQRIPFPLPPLAEQRRIVERLGQLMDKVGDSQKRLSKVPTTLKRFRQSVLAAACSGRLTEDWRERHPGTTNGGEEDIPTDWKSVCVGDVIEGLKYGTAQKCSYKKQGVPVLRIPNVTDGTIDHTDMKYAELPDKELEQLRLHPGDILLIRSNGSVSLVGKCALVREQERDFAYAGYLIRIRPNRGLIEPTFFNLALGSHDIRVQIELEARSTSGVNNINSDEVRELRFLLPPLSEQQEIVRRVEALFTLADQLEGTLAGATTQVDRLAPSLLAKAFRGELVPTEAELAAKEGREYESADILLERVRKLRMNGEGLTRERAFTSSRRRAVTS